MKKTSVWNIKIPFKDILRATLTNLLTNFFESRTFPASNGHLSFIGIGPLSGDGGRVNLNSILIALLTASVGPVLHHGLKTIMSSTLSSFFCKGYHDDDCLFNSPRSRLTSVAPLRYTTSVSQNLVHSTRLARTRDWQKRGTLLGKPHLPCLQWPFVLYRHWAIVAIGQKSRKKGWVGGRN